MAKPQVGEGCSRRAARLLGCGVDLRVPTVADTCKTGWQRAGKCGKPALAFCGACNLVVFSAHRFHVPMPQALKSFLEVV